MADYGILDEEFVKKYIPQYDEEVISSANHTIVDYTNVRAYQSLGFIKKAKADLLMGKNHIEKTSDFLDSKLGLAFLMANVPNYNEILREEKETYQKGFAKQMDQLPF